MIIQVSRRIRRIVAFLRYEVLIRAAEKSDVGQVGKLRPAGNGLPGFATSDSPINNRAQVANLPYIRFGSGLPYWSACVRLAGMRLILLLGLLSVSIAWGQADRVVRLERHVHPQARAEFDQG